MSQRPAHAMDASTAQHDPFGAGALERVVATSAVQREVWLADRLGTEASLAFNESVTLRFEGRLDAAALLVALDGLLIRHPMLRATVSPDGTELLVGAATSGGWTRRDVRTAAPEGAAEAALAEAARRAVQTPFDLVCGPLLRGELLQLADTTHALVLSAHHIVCDGWSWGVLVDDLAALYGEATGVAPAPDPATDDHEAWLRWQHDAMAGEPGLAHERHWLSRFDGASLPVLELPLDRPRPVRRRFDSRRLDLVLDPAEVNAVRQAGARLGASLGAMLLAGFAALLHRLAGQDEVVIGMPAAGQAASGLPRLVDHCVNLLPLRLSTGSDDAFTALLARARDELLDGLEHQALAYGELLARLPVSRDPSRLPLASVMFNLDQALPVATRFAGLHATLSTNPRHHENFELFLNAVQLETGGMRLECQYATALFEASTVDRWLRCYRVLLAAAARDPTARLDALTLLDTRDAAELEGLQGTVGPWVPGLMHDAFVRCAARAGARRALSAGTTRLTYAELDARSNRLARTLRARGVQRGQRVGLCLPREADLVVALLGVLKAGAAYVPLDPAFPAARLAFYAEDARLDLLVTTSTVEAAPLAWRADATSRVLQLDRETAWLQASDAPLEPAGGDAQPGDAAYVIYTSGSTGRPKGVVVPHRAAVNFLAAMQREPGLRADARLAAVTTLSFDIAVLELLLPLACGAEVWLVPRDTAADGAALRRFLGTSGATAMQATPGLWRALLETGWRGGPDFLALVGGEALPPELARDLLAAAGTVWNLYGPTETTVWSTAWPVDPATLAGQGVSIGRPILNTTIRVVDANGAACPIGVPGEILIGGHGVAAGYLDRPELTAERFVPDVMSNEPQARCYRTGDRGRWRHDGQLEHLGRMDRQVKVRGYRIELGEIESALADLPGVSESAVVTHEPQPGDVRLVAHVVPVAGRSLEAGALLDALRERLPEYMLPQHVLERAALPRLPNGKVDRQALPAPSRPHPATPSRQAPRNEAERAVLTAMEDVLKLPGLSTEDDFFRLGGHSLLAARLTTRLSREFAIELPLRTLFEAPTAARLARAVEAARDAAAANVDVPSNITTSAASRSPVVRSIDPSRRSAPLTPMQERIRFVEALHPGRPTYNTPSAHRLRGPLDLAAFRRAFARMVQRQPALRTRLRPAAGGGWEQHVVDDLRFELPLVDLGVVAVEASARGGADEAAVESALAAHLQAAVARPLDIGRAPLFTAALYRIATEHHVLLFSPHHIVWDGWSFDVLYDEMAGLYADELAAPADRGRAVPPVPVASPLDHALAYVEWLDGPDAAAQRAYWAERYTQVPAPHPVPTDRPRTGGMIGRGGWQPLDVDADTATAMRAAARRLGLTTSMLALLAFGVLLSRVSGGPGVVLGMPVRGRPGAVLDHTMGFFNNIVPLPLALPRGATLEALGARVRREVLDALANADVPFEQLAAEPPVAAAASASGLYQAAFSFQDFRARPQHWGPLSHEGVPLFQDGVTEELGVWLAEQSAGMTGGVTYDVDLFDAGTAQLLRDAYLAVLRRLCDSGEALPFDLAGPVEPPALAKLLQWAGQRRAAEAALAARADTAPASTREPDAPLTGRTARLAAVWAELLGIPLQDIRAGDNFFDLGGDSLLAMRAVAAGAGVLGESIEARRYIYESLEQIATAQTQAVADPRAEAPAVQRPREDAPQDGDGGGLFGRLRRALQGRRR